MRRFENYWAEAARWEAEQDRRRRERHRRTREERRARAREQMVMLVGTALFLLMAILAATVYARSLSGETPETAPSAEDGRLPGDDAPATERCCLTEDEVQEDFENEKIEAALAEMGYFREDVPLDFEIQAALRAACDESGVPFELALAVIRKESTFCNISGDGGASVGYMQVQERWHRERMRRLGVTDLRDPLSNFRVGCDYLAELLDKYPTEEALTAYNSGRPGESRYADTVLEYWRELK